MTIKTKYNLEYRNHNGLLQAIVIKIKLLMGTITVASHKLCACKMRTKKTYKWLPSKYCNIHTTMSENIQKNSASVVFSVLYLLICQTSYFRKQDAFLIWSISRSHWFIKINALRNSKFHFNYKLCRIRIAILEWLM